MPDTPRRSRIRHSLIALLPLLLVACTSTAPDRRATGEPVARGPGSPVESCRRGDLPVASEAACLQDDATCYPRADGQWCTGPRVLQCPAGSVRLDDALPCPIDRRCFDVGEGLRCVVDDG